MRRILLTFALSLVVSLPAAAQQLKLAFNDGRVSLDATSVPVRTILVEWGKLGGTKVIGGERIAGSPLTLKLENVPEAQALEIVLRSVAGYMAAPRSAAAAAGASMYDRILVMATSAAPPTGRGRPRARATAAHRRQQPALRAAAAARAAGRRRGRAGGRTGSESAQRAGVHVPAARSAERRSPACSRSCRPGPTVSR